MQGYLLKNSGANKSKKGVVAQFSFRRGSFSAPFAHRRDGMLTIARAADLQLRVRTGGSQWDRRFFVLGSDNSLRYYKKAQDANTNKAPSTEIKLSECLVSFNDADATGRFFPFTVDGRERTLSLRAETELERTNWILALHAAGAQDDPRFPNLLTVPPSPAPPSMLSFATRTTGSARTFVDVPHGVREGQRFQVEVPTVRSSALSTSVRADCVCGALRWHMAQGRRGCRRQERVQTVGEGGKERA